MAVTPVRGHAKMLEATCALPVLDTYTVVNAIIRDPESGTAPQPWDKQNSPTASRNLGSYNLANKVIDAWI